MTIYAFTEPHNDYPAFVNAGETAEGGVSLTVRSAGNGGRNSGTIVLDVKEARALAHALRAYVDR